MVDVAALQFVSPSTLVYNLFLTILFSHTTTYYIFPQLTHTTLNHLYPLISVVTLEPIYLRISYLNTLLATKVASETTDFNIYIYIFFLTTTTLKALTVGVPLYI